MSDKRNNVMDKVRKMLDLAEGSDKQGEVDAALSAAQRLMSEYAIEQVELDRLKQSGAPEKIVKRTVFVGPPGSPISSSKGNLSVAVAETNRCRVYRSDQRNPENHMIEYTLVLVGYESDVEFVEMLWTSLCVQLDVAHDVAKRNKREWVNGRTFRSNFNSGFVSEAWHRLREMSKENELAIEQAAEERGQPGTSLVLRNREKDVADFLQADVGKLRRSYGGNSSYDGHARQAGTSAASRADYSGGRTGRIGARGQIEA